MANPWSHFLFVSAIKFFVLSLHSMLISNICVTSLQATFRAAQILHVIKYNSGTDTAQILYYILQREV